MNLVNSKIADVFSLPKIKIKWKERDNEIENLGKVLHMAEVWVNGQKVGERLWPPFKFDLSKVVKEGNNKIRIRIGNLMVNSMGIKDDLGTLRHWGWDGVPDDASFDAGLFGPVKIILAN